MIWKAIEQEEEWMLWSFCSNWTAKNERQADAKWELETSPIMHVVKGINNISEEDARQDS